MIRKRKMKLSVGKRSVVFGNVNDIFVESPSIVSLTSSSVEDQNNQPIYAIRVSVDQVVLALKHPAVIYFRGVLDVKAIAGSFETMGYQVNDDENKIYTVFSFEGSSANYISTVANSNMSGSFIPELLRHGFSEDVIYKLINHVDCSGAVILLQSAIGQFEHWNTFLRNVNIRIFPNLNCKKGSSIFEEAEQILDTVLDIPGGSRIPKKLNFSRDWDTIMSAFPPTNNMFKVLLCGGKSVGKSTTMRYMINRRLATSEKILVIDLDIGQSEFTVCGSVSAVIVKKPLLGPNFTHLKNPKKSYFVGHVDVSQCLSVYINCIKKLFEFCMFEEQFSSCPWFINTMGMTKGIGFELLATIIKIVQPDFVLQIQSNDNHLNFESELQPQNVIKCGIPCDTDLNYNLFKVRSSVKMTYQETRKVNTSAITPRVLREIVILIYLNKVSVDTKNRDKYMKMAADDCPQASGDQCNTWKLVALSNSTDESEPTCIGFGLAKECFDAEKHYIVLLSPLPRKCLCEIKTVIQTSEINLSKSMQSLITRIFDPNGAVPGVVYSDFKNLDDNKIKLTKKLFYS